MFSTTGFLGLRVKKTAFTGYELVMLLHCVVGEMLKVTLTM